MSSYTSRLVALLACIAVGVSTGCGSSSDDGPEAGSDGETPKDVTIGFSNYALQIPFYKSMEKGIKAKAKEYGWDVVTTDSSFDAGKQGSDVSGLLTRNVDAVIMSPGDANALVPAAKAVKDANKPLITASNQLADAAAPYVLTAYGRSWEEVGKQKTEKLAELMGGKGKMAVVRGPSGTSFVIGTKKGFKETVASQPSIKVVADRHAQSFEAGEGQRISEAALTADPDITGIWVENDDLAVGVAKAIKDRGLTGKVHVVSTDGTSVGVDLVKRGQVDWTLGVPSYDAGVRMVEILRDYLAEDTRPPPTVNARILEITRKTLPKVEETCRKTPQEVYCK